MKSVATAEVRAVCPFVGCRFLPLWAPFWCAFWEPHRGQRGFFLQRHSSRFRYFGDVDYTAWTRQVRRLFMMIYYSEDPFFSSYVFVGFQTGGVSEDADTWCGNKNYVDETASGSSKWRGCKPRAGATHHFAATLPAATCSFVRGYSWNTGLTRSPRWRGGPSFVWPWSAEGDGWMALTGAATSWPATREAGNGSRFFGIDTERGGSGGGSSSGARGVGISKKTHAGTY